MTCSLTLDRAIARGKQAGIVFRPPASIATVADLARTIRVELPEEFAAFYARHDGAKGMGVAGNEDFLSIAEIGDRWQLLCEVWREIEPAPARSRSTDAGIRDTGWCERWIPFTDSPSGDHLCLDLSPDTGGTVGQVIRYWNGNPTRKLVASSFVDWLANVEWTP
jgi:cell wall assembly regulator SMI1